MRGTLEDSDRESPLYRTTGRRTSPYTTTYGDSDIAETWASSDRFAGARQQQRDRRQARSPKSAKFLLVLVTSLTIVIHLSHLVTKGKESTQQFLIDTVKIWHFVCVVIALAVMLIFVSVPKARRLTEYSCSATSPLRMVLLGIHAGFGVAGLTIKIVSLTENPEIDIICLQLYVALSVFCVVQTLFLWRYRKWKCLNWKLKIPLAVLVSANICLSIGASFSFADISNSELIANASKSDNGTNINVTESSDDADSERSCEEVELTHKLVAESLYCLFLFGFYVLSIVVLCEIWNLNSRLGSRPPSPYSRLADSEERLSPYCSNRALALICKIYFLVLKFICRYVLVWSVLLCLGLFVFYLYVNVRKTNLLFIDQSCLICNGSIYHYDELQDMYNWLRTAFYYTMCTIAFIGFLLTFRLESIGGNYSPGTILLLVSGLSQLIIVLFQILDICTGWIVRGSDTFKAETPELYLLKAVFHIINLFSQTYIILKYSGDVQPLTALSNRNMYVRSVIKFLIVVNVDRWARTLTFSPSVTEYLDAIGNPSDTFGREVWCQFSEVVTPVSAIYRLQSALLCYDIYKSSEST